MSKRTHRFRSHALAVAVLALLGIVAIAGVVASAAVPAETLAETAAASPAEARPEASKGAPAQPASDSGARLPGDSGGERPPIFAPDFDAMDDWMPQYRSQSFSARNDSERDRRNIPPGFDFYYTWDQWHPLGDINGQDAHPDRQPSGQISSLVGSHQSPDGKAFVIFDESQGSDSHWGSDAILVKELPEEYPELFIEFYIKFDPNWVWRDMRFNSGVSSMKLFRVYRFYGGDDDDVFLFNHDRRRLGMMYLLNMSSRTQIGTRRNTATFDHHIRAHPYVDNYRAAQPVVINGNYSWNEAFFDDRWHRIAVHVKMSSGPRAADGIVRLFYDGVLQSELTDVMWIANDDASVKGWNMIGFGGNMDNRPFLPFERHEQWYAISGIRVWDTIPAEYAGALTGNHE